MGLKGEITKKAIVNHTIHLLGKKDLDKISVREICESVGIAKGTFYTHFEAKEQVASVILHERLGSVLEVITTIEEREPSLEDLVKILDDIFDFVIENQVFLRLIHNHTFIEYLGGQYMYQHFMKAWIQCVETYLNHGVEKGCFNVEDTHYTAYFIITVVHELIDKIIFNISPFTFQETKLHLSGVVRKLLS